MCRPLYFPFEIKYLEPTRVQYDLVYVPLKFQNSNVLCDLENWIVATVFGATLIKIQFQIFADFGEISGFRQKKREMRTLYHNCQIFSPVEGLTLEIKAGQK